MNHKIFAVKTLQSFVIRELRHSYTYFIDTQIEVHGEVGFPKILQQVAGCSYSLSSSSVPSKLLF